MKWLDGLIGHVAARVVVRTAQVAGVAAVSVAVDDGLLDHGVGRAVLDLVNALFGS